MNYRVLIIDDEEPARDKIAQYLDQVEGGFEVTMAKNAEQAIRQIRSQDFDLMFLDIQMPQMNAFEMLQVIGLDSCPAIIFSTAYDQYALKAFEVHAVDYLLKPYDLDRFRTALQKVLPLIDQQKDPHQMLTQMLQAWKAPTQNPEIIWVNQGSKLVPLEVHTIEYLESDGNYVLIHTEDHKYMLRQSLGDLHDRLDERQFVRVHRSYIVNQKRIREMYPKSHGDLFAVLKSGKKIPVSRRYREGLIG